MKELPINPEELTLQEVFDICFDWLRRPDAVQAQDEMGGCWYRHLDEDRHATGCAACMFIPNSDGDRTGTWKEAADDYGYSDKERSDFIREIQRIHDSYWKQRVHMMIVLAHRIGLVVKEDINHQQNHAIQKYMEEYYA